VRTVERLSEYGLPGTMAEPWKTFDSAWLIVTKGNSRKLHRALSAFSPLAT
jgi:hypothetical protein